MGISYLSGQPWSAWTREERLFCAVLFGHARRDPAAFAGWLIEAAGLGIDPAGEWDLGYEVCFYRDYLWQRGVSAQQLGLPAKRTFDLCLFGEHDVVVIEAKVCEAYGGAQNDDFSEDRSRVHSIAGLEAVNVSVVALAPTLCFANAARFGRLGTLAVFDGCVTWLQVAELYSDELLRQADGMYKALLNKLLSVDGPQVSDSSLLDV